MRPPPVHRGARRVGAIVAAAGLVLSALVPTAQAAGSVAGATDPSVVDIVDTEATPETRSLYASLLAQQGQGVLFGHQHTTDNGITFSQPDGTASDVLAGTGEHPAVFGWDTLVLEGLETPGLRTNTDAQNVQALADGMINAHRLGGINTLSAHMRNFVTGKDFTDSSGRVVSQILPGGPKNAEFTAYLDLVADAAKATVDADGTPIPIIFRPFHENTGSWFWWGAAHATPGEFKEVFRYTVEHLRDTRGVDNLLYAYSPNGAFGGDAERYLATYPGDDWVDVLGYDSYDYDDAPADSSAWIETVRVDLGMVTDLAAERGKIPAFTEFGRNGARTIKPTGNKSLTFYTDLLAAIEGDPKARRIAYMQTWSNWGLDQFYVPYPAHPGGAEHEMYQDFRAFYDDPFTVFSSGTAGVYDRTAAAEPAGPTLRVVSPADGVRLLQPTATIRVKAAVAAPERVTVDTGDGGAPLQLRLDGEHWTAEWNVGQEALANAPRTLTAVATYADGTTLEAASTVILGQPPQLPLGVVDDFEGYGDDASLRAAFAYNNAAAGDLSLVDLGGGDTGLRFAYDFTARSYGGFGKVFDAPQDWSGFDQVEMDLDPDASGQKLVLQVNTANGQSFEAYPSLAEDAPRRVAVDVLDFRAKSDPNRPLRAADLAGVKEFWVYINQVGEPRSSSIVLDDVRAATGDAEPTLPLPPEEPGTTPGLVDDFEGYADDAALRAAWSRPGAATLSLSADVKAGGAYGGAFPFTPGFDEFQKAVGDDWSGFDQLSLWAQPGATEQELVLQLVASGQYYDAKVVLGGAEARTVDLPWSAFTPAPFQDRDPALRPTPAELADVQQLVMFIQPTAASTTDTGVLHLDDIRATVAGGTDPDPEPERAASVVELKLTPPVVRSGKSTKARVTVSSDGEVPGGVVSVEVDGQVVEGQLDGRGRATLDLPGLAEGRHPVTATYAGDERTEGSASESVELRVRG